MQKHDPLVTELKEWIDSQYADGRQTTLTIRELEEKISELTHGELPMP